MISCREVSEIVSSGGLESSAWSRRLSIRLHQLMCRDCRRYSRQIAGLGSLARSVWDRHCEEDAQELAEIEDRIVSSIVRPQTGGGPDEGNS